MMRTNILSLLLLLLLLLVAVTGHAADRVIIDARTEAVIRGALTYLSKNQAPNGSMLGVTDKERQYPQAMTAYTLMAFQAAGQLPGEGEFGANVTRAVKYLLDQVADDGLINRGGGGHYMYTHGITTIALAEAYGQATDPAIRKKLASLVKVIVSSQNNEGGWRYRPIASDADVSVTVLQVVALRAAKNGGIDVPQKTIDDAIGYVRSCTATEGGFAYQPGQPAGFARTAAAIYSLQVCGQYDDPLVKSGSKYLFDNYKAGERWFTYGNFYAAPAQYMIGGDTWARWYALLKESLLGAVIEPGDGSAYWDIKLDPGGGTGPVYSTAVYTMILAMPNHYVPLYQR